MRTFDDSELPRRRPRRRIVAGVLPLVAGIAGTGAAAWARADPGDAPSAATGTPEPASAQQIEVFGLVLPAWLALLLLGVAAYVIATAVKWVAMPLARRITQRTETTLDDRILKVAAGPARFAVALALFGLGAHLMLQPPPELLRLILRAASILLLSWLAFRIVDIAAEITADGFRERNHSAALAVIPLGRRAIKVGLLAVAVIAVLQNVGFNVTGILAGLGVGGLAIALAAQKSVENLFGGVVLIMDQPVRVGDFCRFGDKVGTVEDVGLRSTRIRSLDRTVISVPNAEFSQVQIENFGQRDRIRLYAILGLRYETTPDQLRHVLTELRELLIAHPRVDLEPARVRLVGFGAYSLDLEVFAYVLTSDWNEFLGIREDIFLRIMEILQRCGTGFAFPSQTTYLSRDGGLDAELVGRAEAETRRSREEGRLPFPGFPPERIAALDGTLDWPPLGSAAAATREAGGDAP